jgi:hypothetical protein
VEVSRPLETQRFHCLVAEFVASVSSSIPRSNVFSPTVGLSLLTVAVLSIVAKGVQLYFAEACGQPVRKRVMGWRNSVDWRRQRKSNHPPVGFQQRNKLFQSQLASMSMEKEDRTGNNLLDRLVLFDGELVRGEQSTNGKYFPNAHAHSHSGCGFGNCAEDAGEGELLASSSRRQLHQSGFNNDGKTKVPGFDQYQKLEADPARSVHLRSYASAQSKKPRRLIGERLGSNCSSDPLWVFLGRLFLGLFSLISRGVRFGRPKASRRAVVRNTSRRGKSPERGAPIDFGSHLKSAGFDDGLAAETEMQRWKEENEVGSLEHI